MPDEPVTYAEMQDAFRRIAGSDLGMGQPRWSTASSANAGRPPATGSAGSSWPATPRTSIPRSGAENRLVRDAEQVDMGECNLGHFGSVIGV